MTVITDLVQRLQPDLREDYEECAGKQPGEHAEALALLDVLRRHPTALLGVTVLQVHLDGQPRFVLTTDVDTAHQQLAAVIRAVELSAAVMARFDGLALLTRIGQRKKEHLI